MPAAKSLPLPRGPLKETAVHLCIDMNRCLLSKQRGMFPG